MPLSAPSASLHTFRYGARGHEVIIMNDYDIKLQNLFYYLFYMSNQFEEKI